MRKVERTEKLLQMATDVWNDYKNGAVEYEDLDLVPYEKKYEAAHFPKVLLAPILLKRTAPTVTDAERLRIEINRYVNDHRNPDPETAKAERLEEQTAIAILKGKGYRVMKKTYAYIDL